MKRMKYKLRAVTGMVALKRNRTDDPYPRRFERLECGHLLAYHDPRSKSEAVRMLLGAKRKCYRCGGEKPSWLLQPDENDGEHWIKVKGEGAK